MPEIPVHYDLDQATLPNGLRVVVSPDSHAPAVAVNLWYHVGAADELVGASGFAHLFEHLMFAGSAHVASGEHLGAIEAVGGTANASTTADRTNFFETVPASALDLALWLEADRMASLNVDQTNLDIQREVVKQEKRQRYDNVPYGDLLELLLGLNFPPEHPYHHPTIGSMADLDAAQLAGVQQFFTTWYQPSNAVLTMVGPITAQQGFDLAERYFGNIPGVPAPARPATPALSAHTGTPTLVVHRDVPQAAVHVCWRTPPLTDPESLAVEKALAVLGMGQSSRLHRRLVRDAQIAEAVSAFDLSLARGTSFATASARLRAPHSPADAVEVILAEVTDLAAHGPTPDELQRAQAGFDRAWLSELAPVSERADELSAFATLFGDPTQVNQQLTDMQAVDAEQVANAAARWLAPAARAELDYLIDHDSEVNAC